MIKRLLALKNVSITPLVLLFIPALFAYYPVFNTFFSPLDSWSYFLEMKGLSAFGILLKSISYTSLKIFDQGEILPFRPLTHFYMAFVKILFGNSYFWWHVMQFLMHMLVVFSLYRLLRKINDSVYAFLGALFFSVFAYLRFTVSWEHIGGYLVFSSIILNVVYHLYCYGKGDEYKSIYSTIFIRMLFACFFHEAGFVFTIVFAAYLYLTDKKSGKSIVVRNYLFAVAPAFVYFILMIVDKVIFYAFFDHLGKSGIMTFKLKDIFNVSNIAETLIVVPKLLSVWIRKFFFITDYRSNIADSLLSSGGAYLKAVQYLVMLVSIGVFAKFYISYKRVKQNSLFVSLLAVMALLYTALYAFARHRNYGAPDIVFSNSHPTYIFWIITFVLIYVMVDFFELRKLKTKLWLLGVVVLFTYATLNLVLVRRYNVMLQQKEKPTIDFIDSIAHVIKTHKKEKDFSFKVDNHPEVDMKIEKDFISPVTGKTEKKEFYISEVFFSEYYNKKTPKYGLRFQE